MISKPSIAYVLDPRFPGGTSSAVATELKTVARLAKVTVHAVTSKMFKGKTVSPTLQLALQEMGQDILWDAPTINADVVILHNPSFLKFDTELSVKIVTRHLIVVAHENFLRPGRAASFDVMNCLSLIDRSCLALRKSIAPISSYNRATIMDWIDQNPTGFHWSVLDQDWFNICDFSHQIPTGDPKDRRGRHSRPGVEKFPAPTDMDLCFPEHAKTNVILGGDLFIRSKINRPHWTLYPFNGLELDEYFKQFDFMVYFTARTWHESFGRVLAEAIAAGKVVISDPSTASTFGNAVISSAPSGVDNIIENFVHHPQKYQEHVTNAQARLGQFTPAAFEQRFLSAIKQSPGMPS